MTCLEADDGRMSTTDTSTVPASTVPADTDPRELFARAVAVATPVVDGTRPDQFRLGTPCAAFDVEQLLGHLVFAVGRVATVGKGDELGILDEVVTSDDWSADFRIVTAEARDAWSDDRRLTDTVVLPWATMTGAEALGVYINEVTTHTWDLAQATGQAVQWDDDVVRAALAAIEQQLPIGDRDPIWQSFLDEAPTEVTAGFSPPFANAVGVAEDAPLIDRLVAWNGRRP
jgi:uncharacterized protein (TIGR03086 family)